MSPPNPQPQPNPDDQTPQLAEEEEKKTTKNRTLPIAILIVRVITMVCLLVSLIIIVSDTATINGVYQVVTIRFNNLINTYRYMVSAIVLGLVYTCLQVASGIQHLSTGKYLVNCDTLPMFDLFGDQVVLCLIGTGMGAAFGATVELKKTLDLWAGYFETHGNPFPVLTQSRPKLDYFFNMANLSASFLFFAFLTSAVSSLLSFLSFSNKQH